MTVTGRAEDLDGRHTYVHPVTGEIFPAVGSILSSTNEKYWKADWAAKLGAQWTVEHLDLVVATKNEAGPDAAVDLIKGRARAKREFKANVGSYVHTVLETLILGGGSIPPIPDALLGEDYAGDPLTPELVDGIVDGFLAFNSDFDVDYEFSEVTICNRRLRYAGTLDMGAVIDLGNIGAERQVIDAKTGAILEWTMVCQQAAYSDPENELWLPNGQIVPIPHFEAASILHLRRDYDTGYKLLRVPDADLIAAREDFAVMRAQYDIQQRRSKTGKVWRVIYPPLPDGTQPPPLIEDVDGIEGFGRCRGKLLAAGLRELADIAALTVVQLRQVDGIGPKAAIACDLVLKQYGMGFAAERVAS